MRINPQAIINSGIVGSSGGINIGTNVPCGINNKHRFASTEERDAYFPNNLHELERLITIIIVGSDLQLWTGDSQPSAYDNTKWSVMTWVIQGPQGVEGLPGIDGVGIRSITASLSQEQLHWQLNVSLTNGTVETLQIPVPDMTKDIVLKVSSLMSRFNTTGTVIDNMNNGTSQGRYAINQDTISKPPMVTIGSVDVHKSGDTIIQVVHTDTSTYKRTKKGNQWSDWISGGSSGGGLSTEQENALISLTSRLPEVASNATDLNTYNKQGRFCYNQDTQNKPGSSQHGSIDVYSCDNHILQLANTVEGEIYHRTFLKSTGVWGEWTQISDLTGGATIHQFPKVSSVYTTQLNIRNQSKEFYIPWTFIVHDNYGCTPRIVGSRRPADLDHWWVAPKPGSYDMQLYVDMSFIQTQATIPNMLVAKAFLTDVRGRETLVSEYELPFDVGTKIQTVKLLNLRLDNIHTNEKVRWQITVVGGSWSQEDNPNVAMTPFRTMLVVDEADYDTGQRIGAMAFRNLATFYAFEGTAATVGLDSDGKARLNAVKWSGRTETVTAKPKENY